MIKRVKLGGISNKPSDVALTDGGCIASVNVDMVMGEIAPTIEPSNKSYRYSRNNIVAGEPLFIHKGNTYENLIYRSGNLFMAYVVFDDEYIGEQTLFNSNANLIDIKSIGNTLIIATDEGLNYILFKNKTYLYLGNKIPKIAVEFKGDNVYFKRVYQTIITKDEDIGKEQDIFKEHKKKYNTWGKIFPSHRVNIIKEDDGNIFAVFVRYALKLYDNSYIYQSVPILIGTESLLAMLTLNVDDKVTERAQKIVEIESLVRAHAYTYILQMKIYENSLMLLWKDIVKSVDVFVSTDIYPYADDTELKLELLYDIDMTKIYDNLNIGYDYTAKNGLNLFEFNVNSDVEQRLKQSLLSKGVFYLVNSVDIEDLSRYADFADVIKDKRLLKQDILVTQPTLADGYNSFHSIKKADISTYNNKLMLTNIHYELSRGYPFANALGFAGGVAKDKEQDSRQVKNITLKFYVGDNTVFSHNINGGLSLITNNCNIYGFLAYPDPKCKRVDIDFEIFNGSHSTYYGASYPMEEHPHLNCAVLYTGINKRLGIDSLGTDLRIDVRDDEKWEKENRLLPKIENKLLSSKMDNPFVFPAEGVLNFDDKILSTAVATRALSEGQFGQFPLYVFTETGIYAVGIGSAGEFVNKTPVSRDIAINKETIIAIEQAVVFVSKSGVHILNGSEIKNISPLLTNLCQTNTENILNALKKFNNELLKTTTQLSEKHFYVDIANSQGLYDYASQRIIFAINGTSRAYVYNIIHNTWHSLDLAETISSFQLALNSYPDCFISVINPNNNYQILDLSNTPEAEYNDIETNKGLIITRPMDFELPYIRKAIKDLRIRGNYGRERVKYILLASMDGINWGVLSSLRGGSYKWFCIALLTNLYYGEFISFIDFDIEERFNDKLR